LGAVALRAASRRAQRGIALLGLLAVAVTVFAYVLTSRLNDASRFVGVDREHNAKVLSQAKQALIGYMAQQAALAGENDPGHLPCPEAPGNFGTSNEGIEASFCTAPAVGRLPWRTLGLDKLVDSAGEPLWYAVSNGWHRPNSSTNLTINSDSLGQLTVDGAANSAVALIIAPGTAIVVGGGCAAWSQSRSATGAPDLRNYLECGNETGSFISSSPGNTFNDQALRVTAADVMPALEAAIADRMQREIAPALRAAAYTSTQYSGIPAGVPLYPYPVPFTNPTTSSYLGVAGNASPQGLLPFNQINGACTAPPPCTTLPVSHPHSVRSTLFGYLLSYSCSTSAAEVLCEGQYHEDDTDPTRNVRIEMAATFSDVAMGFRALAATPLSHTLVEARDNGSAGAWVTPSPTIVQIKMNDGATTLPDGTLPPRGSVTIRFHATLPNIDVYGWNVYADFRIRINRAVFDDHALLKKTDPTLGWFVRNEWYRNTYYAVAQANTADWLPSLGCSAASSNCIRFNDSATYNMRALLVLAGRRLPTQAARPSSDRLAYVEGQNGDGGTLYVQVPARMSNVATSSPFNAPWNDRIILVDWDSASPPNAGQVVSLTPLRVVTLP
jgi:hypothetical protein